MAATSKGGEEHLGCGLYRTTEPIDEDVPAGALVYFHNHGDPGPGVYLPQAWKNNRAVFHERGTVLPHPAYRATLQPLRHEGLYRVREPFFCCEDRCHYFEQELLVQLGYNARADAILFVPQLVEGTLALPSEGTRVGDDQLGRLTPLRVATTAAENDGSATDARPPGAPTLH
ncbi:MAG: hypothetical protein IPL40_01320 [Proteobacteria bacterium]|nr:hypothetical protein [Pseudomonadota bacterium]